MKKLLCITLAAVMVLSLLTACSGNAAVTETAAETVAETAAETEAETEQMAGLANPMVEVEDPTDFEDQLGICIDPSEITEDYKLFIIDGKIAHIRGTDSKGYTIKHA